MKKVQIVSWIVLVITMIGMLLGRFVVPFPDWAVRVIGIVMLCAIFMVSFSTAHMVIGKK